MGLISRVSSRTYRYSVIHTSHLTNTLRNQKKHENACSKNRILRRFHARRCLRRCSKTATAPIERVKLLIQNQDEMIKQGRLNKPYNGVIDCTKRVLSEEGLGPFWRGNMANVIRYFPTQALNFAFKERIKAIFAVPKDASQLKKVAANIASGGCAGTLSLMFVYSLDFARTRLANDAKGKDGKRQFNGLIDVYKKTIASDGIGGLYRGFVISCVGIFIYRGLYFGIYDSIKPIILGDNASAFFSFFVGW